MKSKSTKQRRIRPARRVLSCALASCLMLGMAPAFAQSAGANVRGQVANASGGTEVVATNAATGAVRRTQTNANGAYTLVGLEPGIWSIEAGQGPAQRVQLTVASTTTLNLASAAPADGGGATTLDTVTVTAPPVLQEVKTSEVAKFVSLREIQTTPQMSRNFLEFADSVPGMKFTRDAKGNTSLRGGAQNTSSTNVYIDGVGQKSYVKEGGVAGQFGSAGNPFPQLAIGEYKVITSNYKAEYGQISSAAVTAVTKSGTNEFHGEAFYRYTDEGLRQKTLAEDRQGTDKSKSQEKEYGFSLGGPIIQDRMHFFLTYEAKRFDLPVVVAPDSNALGKEGFLPPNAAAMLGPASQQFEEDLFFGKIDWEITDNDRIELSMQDRDETQESFSGSNSREHGSNTDNTDRRYALRWEHSADRWFNEVLLTHEDSFNNPVPVTYGNGYYYTTPDGSQDPNLVQIGGGSPLAAQTKGQKGWSIEDNLTFNSFEWHGDHTIKMGVRYKEVDLHAADAMDINPQFYYTLDNPDFTDQTPYKAFFTKPVEGVGGVAPSVKSSAKQYGIYIQDDWAVNDKLTLNLGVRWDYEKNPSYLDFVTPDAVVDGLNSQDPNGPAGQSYAQSLALGGIDINNYISNGHNRKAFDGAWQPRLGFSYDLNADQMHVIHGGAGRSYDRDLYDYLQLEVTKSALPQFTINFRDPATGECYRDATPCFDWNPDYLNGLGNLQGLVSAGLGGEVDLLNNKLKAPYSDQFSLGMSNQIGDWQTDATVTRILSHDGFVFTLGNRRPDGSYFLGRDAPFGNGVPNFGSLIIGNNGLETRTTQVLLSAQKNYTKESGWGTSFSYTYTNAKQNRDINEHYSFDAPTIGDYPFILSNAAPRHRFVATGSIDGPWGITFGGKLTLETPTPGNTVPCVGPNGTDAPGCVPRPSAAIPSGNGRFLFGGGKIWGYRSVDLQATKEFQLAGGVSAYARLDILNVFNFKNPTQLSYFTTAAGRVIADYNMSGDIVGVPRQIKAEVGVRF